MLLGLSALARGNGLIFFAGLGLLLLFRCNWKKVLVAGIIGALPVLAWSGLNYHWYGHFKPTSSGDANVAASIVGPVMAELEGQQRTWGPDQWLNGEDWTTLYDNQFEFAAAMRDRAVTWAKEHPVQVAVGNVKGWFRSLLGPGAADISRLTGPVAGVVISVSIAVRFSLLIGLAAFFVSGAWRQQRLLALIVLLGLISHIVAPGAAGLARFGFPIDALNTIALVALLASMTTRRRSFRKGVVAR